MILYVQILGNRVNDCIFFPKIQFILHLWQDSIYYHNQSEGAIPEMKKCSSQSFTSSTYLSAASRQGKKEGRKQAS